MENRHEFIDPYALLRTHGMRATPQRVAIAGILLRRPMHVTPQDVYETMSKRFPSISQNTIYLTLAHFEEAGLVHRFHISGRTVFDSNTARHDHAYCRHCGKVVDLPSSDIEKIPKQITSWKVKSESRIWFGLCPACKKAGVIPG